MKLLLAFILVSIAHYGCFASDNFLLKGKSGDAAMVMLFFPAKDGTCTGKYFCLPDLQDKDFEGQKDGNGYRLYVLCPGDNASGRDTLATISLKPAQNHIWVGQFVSKTHIKSVIRLKEQSLVEDSCYAHYTDERKACFRFVKKDTGSQGKIKYSWYGIENSPVTYLHIDKGMSPAAALKINQAMISMGTSYAEAYFSCTYQYLSTDYSFEISDFYISGQTISLCASGSYSCGNASIEDWSDAYNFSTTDGSLLRLEDVLYLCPVTHTRPVEEDSHFLSEDYTQKLVELLTSLYPQQMAEPKEELKCNFSDNSVWQYSSWYFTSSGIFIQPSFRHFSMECGDEKWSLINYNTVARYKNPKARLRLPLH